MTHAKTRAALALALPLLLLTGCSGGTTTSGAQPSAASGTSAAAPATTPAPDLTGDWKQVNSKSKDAYQTATIDGDTIEVNYVADNGDTTSLFWAGSFDAPTKAGDYEWVSKNDTEKTKGALTASPDKTKKFKYTNGQISYPLSFMGVNTTIRLEKQS